MYLLLSYSNIYKKVVVLKVSMYEKDKLMELIMEVMKEEEKIERKIENEDRGLNQTKT